jgi:23S rRNA (pseudouridine1915-N3)-methyltransferase
MMKIYIGKIDRSARAGLVEAAIEEYRSRLTAYSEPELVTFKSAQAMSDWLQKQRQRVTVVLLDSRGRQLSSEGLAHWIGARRDEGQRPILFAIGPADGWTDVERQQADLLLSFGLITMNHELARLLVAEQLYRAFTILAGHPYHSGH